ncbi:hypothetical protein QQ045_008951 [Rhodiola kirilowii]
MASLTTSSNFIISKLTAHSRSSSTNNHRFPKRAAATMASELHSQGRSRFLEFPHASTAVRSLMVELVSMVEDQLGSQLQPCSLPEDVQFYQNETGRSQASLHIRSCSHPSQVDFILGSWLHFGLPTGGKLDITSLTTYLKSTTDAPIFLMEIIQSNPTSMLLILDLPPRKDLVLHPEYLQTFYEDTKLDVQRQLLSELPEVSPFVLSSLYVRSLVSPTAILVNVQAGEGGQERLDEIVADYIHPVAVEVLRVWIDGCALVGRELGDEERSVVERRDGLVKKKSIEMDLETSLPMFFEKETADRVLAAIKDVFSGKEKR